MVFIKRKSMVNHEHRFQLMGPHCEVFDFLRAAPALEGVCHIFVDENPNALVVHLDGKEITALPTPASGVKLIILAQPETLDGLWGTVPENATVWRLPMSEEELSFRFGRWQRSQREETSPAQAYRREVQQKTNTIEHLFTSLDCGIICHTLDGSSILSINEAALRILDYETAEEMAAAGFRSVAQSVLDEDKHIIRDGIASLRAEGDSVNVEYRVIHKDGTLHHVMGNIKLIRENGELCCQRFLLDVTEQKSRELENERHQAELIKALSVDYSFVFFVNLDTGESAPMRVSAPGHHLMERLGDRITFESVRDIYIEEMVHPGDKERVAAVLNTQNLLRVLEERQVIHFTYRLIRDGREVYNEMKIVRGGRWEELRGIVLGIRSVDEEVREDIAHRQALEDALTQANRASQAKSTFLFNISHDIRTPMNAIVGFTTLAIAHMDQSDKVREYLRKIMASSNHMLSLINDVLDMSRIESGKLHLEETPCDIFELIQGVDSIILTEVHAKKHQFRVDTSDVRDDRILCDKLRLDQVLLNLLSNAVKYTPDGGEIELRVAQEELAPQGYGQYTFTVTDNGIGMAPEFLNRIFEPFERERNSTTSGIQGTGLGMAITKNIVDMMGGSIHIDSAPGRGTRVMITFTFRLDDGAEMSNEMADWRGRRALVVEADPHARKNAVRLLEQAGLRVDSTDSGLEAVSLTKRAADDGDGYQLCLLDWSLADIHSAEVAQHLQTLTQGTNAIIVMTVYDWSGIEEEARAVGIHAFCTKPLYLNELEKCLRDMDEDKAVVSNGKSCSGRLLLVEDNELNQEIAAAILEDAGLTVELAENGQLAVERIQAVQADYYNLILMDIQMPVMNGYEATKAIRALPDQKKASIPILAMTANAFEEDRNDALQAGMNGHISKPIDVEKLFETIAEFLD